jgi:hypothetical protein
LPGKWITFASMSNFLEDLRDLKKAVQRNGDKPLISLAKVKKDLDLD